MLLLLMMTVDTSVIVIVVYLVFMRLSVENVVLQIVKKETISHHSFHILEKSFIMNLKTKKEATEILIYKILIHLYCTSS